MNPVAARRLANRHSAYYLFSHTPLLLRITSSELAGRYAGSVFGLAWALLMPLLVLSLYAVTYTMILNVRVPDLATPLQYTLFIFAGMVPFLSTAEALAQGVSSVAGNRSVLTNTVFPIDLAPVKAVLKSQVVMVVGMASLVAILCLTAHVRATVVLLPLVWLLHLLALTGVLWFLSLLNVVLRDLQIIVGLLTMVLMVVSPIAYAPANVPANIRFLLYFNPFAWYVVVYQKVLILGDWPSVVDWVRLLACSAILFGLGGYFFKCMKKAITDHV